MAVFERQIDPGKDVSPAVMQANTGQFDKLHGNRHDKRMKSATNCGELGENSPERYAITISPAGTRSICFLFGDKHMHTSLRPLSGFVSGFVLLLCSGLAIAIESPASLVAGLAVPELAMSGPTLPAPEEAQTGAVAAPTFSPLLSVADLVRKAKVQFKSRSVLVVRADNGEVLYRKNVDHDIPIASITKLMTAMVVLDAQLPLDEIVTIAKADMDTLRRTPSRLTVGTQLTRGDLMLLALMSSENRAAAALARSYPGGSAAAIAAMNQKAVALGMTQTHFVDGAGLSSKNRASPIDLVRMVKAAESYDDIRRYSTTTRHAVKVGRYMQIFHNTNPLVKNPNWAIAVTKTGFLNDAGRCLVMQARIAELPVIMVLMNSVGSKTRVGDANRLRKWLESAVGV